MKYLDLTMLINPRTPVYPGDPRVQVKVAAELVKDGYLDHVLTLGTHVGTHIDAPAHMIAGGKMLAEFGPETFIGRGVVVDAIDGLYEGQLAELDIRSGDIVLIRTGASDFRDEGYYDKVPNIDQLAVDYLIKKQVQMVGVDAGSIDVDPFVIHRKLLGANILLIENLVNLSSLVGLQFRVVALPINLEVEAAPARVIAELV